LRNNRKPLIGLTGTICAGKNYVGRLLEERGLPVLDVDKQGYEAIERVKALITGRFGGDILNPDGTVNRRLLGAKVFRCPGELAALEAMVHPVVNRMTLEWAAAQEGPCVINAALLHKSAVFPDLAALILVEAPWFTRLVRARKRDGLSWAALARRFGSQRDFASQYLRGNSDIYRVVNKGFLGCFSRFRRERLEKRLDRILFDLGIRRL
jgi:dephospho-CoA kinase